MSGISGKNVCCVDQQSHVGFLSRMWDKVFLPDHIPENNFGTHHRDRPNRWKRRCGECLLSKRLESLHAMPRPALPLWNRRQPADSTLRGSELHPNRYCQALPETSGRAVMV